MVEGQTAQGQGSGNINVDVEDVDASDEGKRQRSVAAPHRDFPELITEEQVNGGAATPIAEGRLSRRIQERAASALERLRADERLLELELLLVGAHGLTLPPADRPWDGIRRQSELRLLDQALGRVRRERRRAQLVHWSLRLLTLGLWGLLERRRFARLRRSH